MRPLSLPAGAPPPSPRPAQPSPSVASSQALTTALLLPPDRAQTPMLALHNAAAAFVAPSGALRGAAPTPASSDSMKIEGMVGDCAPLGFFDPFGFSKGASKETMNKYREAELKHGRVAMLACFGMITADATSVFPRVFKDYSSNPLAAISQVVDGAAAPRDHLRPPKTIEHRRPQP